MNEILFMIFLPVLAGLLLFLLPRRAFAVQGIISCITVIATGYFSIVVFKSGNKFMGPGEVFPGLDTANFACLQIDSLSKLILLFIGLFGVLILCYSLIYNKKRPARFYAYFLITLGASYGAVLSDNLLVFITFWGLLGITLYKLIPGTDEESSAAAKKTLIMIGASDGIMILGIAIIWKITGSLSMAEIKLPTDNALTVCAFLTLITGSFTKAGAFPFHSWIPDYTRYAPASSSAYLPASLDKLLGIYFLARITTGIFELTDGLRLLLLSLGVITIIAAVMMALIQHNYKRLLGFHAVSQVGYMILGFGLGSLIGIAGGLFHMINNAVYKSGLFLTAGSVEFRTGREDIDELGGLSKSMPVTFFAALIFALSISGVPPLNGFASKWMIYQGIIDFGSGDGIANKLWIIWLGLAVFGSALTLASFIKFIGGVFLSRQKPEFEAVREVPLLMWAPMLLLALICIGAGVFATNYIVPEFLMPVTGKFHFTGFWDSSFVSMLVLISIIMGILLYLLSGLKKFRLADSFIGGEKFHEKAGYPVTGFYHTIREFKLLSWVYSRAEEGTFDLYELSKRFTLWFSARMGEAHTGVLPVYAIWVIAGLVIMLFLMI
ncbi:MAG TPA: proton-conducting transporter membrane subunit [Bacteroidales bacterium]|nr:proton-conducting transporter membrane subunit [Bacteroidales bacterium]